MSARSEAEYDVDKDNPIEIHGREGSCHIGIPGEGPTEGEGGFAVSQGGVVTGVCKVDKRQ